MANQFQRMNLEQYAKNALANYHARHAKADDLQYNLAGFTWNPVAMCYEVEVREHIVATFKTLAGVKAFSAMHNTERTA